VAPQGGWAKFLDRDPRHRRIVGAAIGQRMARPLTRAIGLGEVALGVWIMSGRRPLIAGAMASGAIAVMNLAGIVLARDEIARPRSLIVRNAAFVALGWAVAVGPSTGSGT
jgi:hypothetical protein